MSDLRNKVQNISPELKAQDVKNFAGSASNIYEALNIIARRARFLSTELKTELNGKLEEFAITSDRIEEVLENKEQIEISKFYERIPSPSVIATHEFLNGQLDFHYRNQKNDDEQGVD